MSTPKEGLTTGWDVLNYAFNTYANCPSMGTRTFLGEHTPEVNYAVKPSSFDHLSPWLLLFTCGYFSQGSRFPLKKFGETTWQSYKQVGDRAKSFGRGLKALGVESCTALSTEEPPHPTNPTPGASP